MALAWLLVGQNNSVGNYLPGRPKSDRHVRERLISAARELILRDGYSETSVRAIAAQAGVDHKMVNYYFGSKAGLFAELLAISLRPPDVVDGIFRVTANQPPLVVARTMLATLLGLWDEVSFRDPVIAAMRLAIAQDDELRGAYAEFAGTEILGRLSSHLRIPHARTRSAGIITVITGLIFSRYLMRIEPLASMKQEDIIATLAPMIAIQLDPRTRT